MTQLYESNTDNPFWNISESDLKLIKKNNPIVNSLTHYVKYYYRNHLRQILFYLLKHIRDIPIYCNSIIIIDLDETFIQNADFYPHTLGLWTPTLQHVYRQTGKVDIGAVLPYMYILYAYLIHKQISVVFLTGRKEKLRTLTRKNLKMFGVTQYHLFMTPDNLNSYVYKNMIVQQLSVQHDIIAILNDQSEIIHDRLVKFPQLYTV